MSTSHRPLQLLDLPPELLSKIAREVHRLGKVKVPLAESGPSLVGTFSEEDAQRAVNTNTLPAHADCITSATLGDGGIPLVTLLPILAQLPSLKHLHLDVEFWEIYAEERKQASRSKYRLASLPPVDLQSVLYSILSRVTSLKLSEPRSKKKALAVLKQTTRLEELALEDWDDFADTLEREQGKQGESLARLEWAASTIALLPHLRRLRVNSGSKVILTAFLHLPAFPWASLQSLDLHTTTLSQSELLRLLAIVAPTMDRLRLDSNIFIELDDAAPSPFHTRFPSLRSLTLDRAADLCWQIDYSLFPLLQFLAISSAPTALSVPSPRLFAAIFDNLPRLAAFQLHIAPVRYGRSNPVPPVSSKASDFVRSYCAEHGIALSTDALATSWTPKQRRLVDLQDLLRFGLTVADRAEWNESEELFDDLERAVQGLEELRKRRTGFSPVEQSATRSRSSDDDDEEDEV
ncbi:hypothetical protein JCM8097_001505 [Rhodosporidiobolus ruineniae]